MTRLVINDNKSLFFTADTHFGHKNIINLCKRSYQSVEDMNTQIISKWNEVVSPTDTIIHLGDFSFHNPKLSTEIRGKLNGNIILVKGNHDTGKIIDACGFTDVVDFLELKVSDGEVHQPISCMHYPMAVWPLSHYGAWHLHGHSHGSYRVTTGKLLDVGWDVWHKPISYAAIKKYMANRSLLEVDHHSIKEYRANASN